MNVSNNTVQIEANTNGDFFVLPECFWDLAENITVFTARNLVVIGGTGSSTSQDPLLRLSAALLRLDLQNVALLASASGASSSSPSYSPSWDAFFASKRELEELTLDNVGLAGALPSYLPTSLSKFVVANNRLSGALPSGLLSNATFEDEFVLNLANNALSGTIPSTFVQQLKPNVANFQLDLSYNAFTGALPATLFTNVAFANATSVIIALNNNMLSGEIAANFFSASFSAVDTLQVNMSSNLFSGSLSPYLFSSITSAALRSLSFDASSNVFTGSVPSFLATLPHPEILSDASFILSKNRLSGSLPTAIAANSSFTALTSLEWRVDSNSLSGAIPASLFAPSTNSLGDLSFYAQNNALIGSVPGTLLSVPNFESLSAVRISFASNRLNASLDNALLTALSGSLNDISLDLSSNPIGGSISASFLTPFTVDSETGFRVLNLNLANCSLTGTIPAGVFGSLTSLDLNLNHNKLNGTFSFSDLLISAGSNSYSIVTFSAAGNQLSGQVYLPGLAGDVALFLNVSSNHLTNLSVDSNVTYVHSLDLSNNTGLAGSVPSIFFSVNASLEVLKAAHTNLSGVFPAINSNDELGLETLDLSYTTIDFCSGSRTAWTSSILSSCLLLNTNADSCASSYPAVCDTSSVATPTAPGTPTAPSTTVPGPIKTPTGSAQTLSAQWFLAVLLISLSAFQLLL